MVVLDTSTLILLAKIDLLPLLAEKTRIRIPKEVQQEALVKPQLYDAKMIVEMIRMGKIQVWRELPVQFQKQLQEDFGVEAGEASALLLARQIHAPIATDDGLAIKAAKVMGIPFMTSLHVLTELYTKGRIDQKTALYKLEKLEKIGRYSLQLMEDARESIQKKR